MLGDMDDPSHPPLDDVGPDGVTPPKDDLQKANQKHDDAAECVYYGMIVVQGKPHTCI
jgi:hypothetical protein